MNQFYWENEWRLQELKEESFILRNIMPKTPKWIGFVEKKVPDTLQNTLNTAFDKAFVTVFEKGSGFIEKTYNKEKQIHLFRKNVRTLRREDFHSKSVKKFEKQAKRTIRKNLFIALLEGIGLGIIGCGIPDIPIFVSVLLKSMNEIAISFGFCDTSDREKLFILKIIDSALKNGDALRRKDIQLDRLIDRYVEEEQNGMENQADEFVVELQIIRQINDSADALSHELLYGKFVQGMTFIGVVGGITNFTCLKRITEYAVLKYKRRFLLHYMPEEYMS